MAGSDRDRGDAEATPPKDYRLAWPSGSESSGSAADTDLRLAWGTDPERPAAAAPAAAPEVETPSPEPVPEPAPEPLVESVSAERSAERPATLSADAPLIRLRTRGSSAGITIDDHAACRQEIERLQAEIQTLRAEISALQEPAAPAPKVSGRAPGRLRGRP